MYDIPVPQLQLLLCVCVRFILIAGNKCCAKVWGGRTGVGSTG